MRFTLRRSLQLFGWRHPVRAWRQWRLWGRRPFGPIRAVSLSGVAGIVKRTFDAPPAKPVRTRSQAFHDMVKRK